jgi:hypothetical protein
MISIVMNTSNWKYYYKRTADHVTASSNMLYTALMNPTNDILCKHYCINEDYQGHQPGMTQEIVDFFFEREVRFLEELQYLSCTPKLLKVDRDNNKVFIEWNTETLSQIVFDPNRSIDDEFPNWKDQLYSVVKEFKNSKHYKLALYPHCFFINKDGAIKVIDYYSVVPHDDSFIEKKLIAGMIGDEGSYRFDQSETDGVIDLKNFFNLTMNIHLPKCWPDCPFPEFFNKLY